MYLELGLYIAQVHLEVGSIVVRSFAPVELLWSDLLNFLLELRWVFTFKAFNAEKSLGDVQKAVSENVFEQHLVIVMDSISFFLVFEASKHLEIDLVSPECGKIYLVAGVVFICAGLHSPHKLLRLDMHQLDDLSILDELTLFPFEGLLVLDLFLLDLAFQRKKL
jgi:hypothetical protein